METDALEAELHRTSALLREAEERRNVAAAVIAQRRSQCRLAEKELKRAISLFEQQVGSEQQVDIQSSRFEMAEAACDAAHAALVDAEAAIDAGAAQVERIQADIGDGILVAPRSGRIQYRLAEPGEVLPAGGKALTVVDLDDVYMTLFLPEQEAGRVRIGAEAQIVLDALPDRPIRARVSFVASEGPVHAQTGRDDVGAPEALVSREGSGSRRQGSAPQARHAGRRVHSARRDLAVAGASAVRDDACGSSVAGLRAITHRYGSTKALDGVTLEVPAARMVGLIGPDGVGKSTLLGLIAGVRRIQDGRVVALGGDMGEVLHRSRVCPRIAYMPQGLGGNLYPDLSVVETIDFFGRLFGQTGIERRWRIGSCWRAPGSRRSPAGASATSREG